MTRSIENLPKLFGEKVRTLRQKAELSQEQLAFKTGLDRTYISGIERGRRNPSLKNIGKLSAAFKIKLHDLMDL